MLRAFLGIGLTALFGVGSAQAGPWAREQGDVFLSFSLSSASSRDQIAAGALDPENYLSAYAEVGLGRRLTLGFDLGGDDDSSLNTIFLRRTFTPPNRPLQIAADLGFGRRETEGGLGEEVTDVYRLGFSIGRGVGPAALDWHPFLQPSGGWMSLDTSYLHLAETGDALVEAEGTLGLNITGNFAGLLQLQAEQFPIGDTVVTLTPSVLYRIRGGPMSAQVGTRIGLAGSEEVGLQLGLWREF